MKRYQLEMGNIYVCKIYVSGCHNDGGSHLGPHIRLKFLIGKDMKYREIDVHVVGSAHVI